MKTLQIKTYTFEELTPEAKKTAIENHRDINTDYEWYDYLITDWTERLEEEGFTDADIQFTGFASQGDGASFTAQIDLVEWIGFHPKYSKLLPFVEEGKLSAYITRLDRHYSHANTCASRVEAHYSIEDQEILDLCTGMEEEIEEQRLDRCEGIYTELGNENDHLTSDKMIAETLECNEYLFTEDGKRSYTL